MAGYSATPLPKKLGIQEKSRVTFVGLPADVKAELRDSLAGCSIVRGGSGPLDFAMVFATKEVHLKSAFGALAQQLAVAGMLWVSWPKKASGVATDIDENKVRRIGLEAGLVDVKVCAISDVWSGLKFVRRVRDRKKQAGVRVV